MTVKTPLKWVDYKARIMPQLIIKSPVNPAIDVRAVVA